MGYIVPLQQLGKNNIPTAGGKGANLGEMTAAGFAVPSGFVLITEAYDDFVQAQGLQQQIVDLASKVSAGDPQSSDDACAAIRALFLAADMPEAIRVDLLSAYADLTTAPKTPPSIWPYPCQPSGVKANYGNVSSSARDRAAGRFGGLDGRFSSTRRAFRLPCWGASDFSQNRLVLLRCSDPVRDWAVSGQFWPKSRTCRALEKSRSVV